MLLSAQGEVSDAELIERCLSAQEVSSQAFSQLYERHASAVLAFLYGMYRGDEHGARDALQETFIRFYTALPSFQQGRPLRPWLYRISRNVALDHWKLKKRRPEGSADPGHLGQSQLTPAQAAEEKEAARLLRRAVHDLPAQELAVFLLRHDQSRTYEEVAEALSCSIRTAKYRMKSALERLGREAERLGVAR